ncbi:MAG: hypothetical protein ACFE0J_03335 [Elainellaceae cyanobacterium]
MSQPALKNQMLHHTQAFTQVGCYRFSSRHHPGVLIQGDRQLSIYT